VVQSDHLNDKNSISVTYLSFIYPKIKCFFSCNLAPTKYATVCRLIGVVEGSVFKIGKKLTSKLSKIKLKTSSLRTILNFEIISTPSSLFVAVIVPLSTPVGRDGVTDTPSTPSAPAICLRVGLEKAYRYVHTESTSTE
jgi:hypothetical protein